MVRFLASVAIRLVANALGLVVAALVLDDLSVSASAFVVDVVVFTLVMVVAQPLVQKTALKHSEALLGSSALVASLLALVLTTYFSDGMRISGLSTWLLATVIVWAVSLLVGLLLPVLVFKRAVREVREVRR